MAIFKISESSVSLVKDENAYNGSFASLILECQENDARIFNAVLESDYEEAVRITEGTLLEGERARKAWKTVKDVSAIILDALKQFGQKLKQLFDAAVSKIKEIHAKRIGRFAEKFEKDFDPSNYDEKKLPSFGSGKLPVPMDDPDEYLINDVDIGHLMDSILTDVEKISNRKDNPDYVKEVISNAFKSSRSMIMDDVNSMYPNEKYITPSMISKAASSVMRVATDRDVRRLTAYATRAYSRENISNTVSTICGALKSANTTIASINKSRKEAFRQLDDVISNVKKSEKSLERTRACLELSSAYQTVISTIANTNIKVVMSGLKNNIKVINYIKSATKKKNDKDNNKEGEEAAAATNEMFSMLF